LLVSNGTPSDAPNTGVLIYLIYIQINFLFLSNGCLILLQLTVQAIPAPVKPAMSNWIEISQSLDQDKTGSFFLQRSHAGPK